MAGGMLKFLAADLVPNNTDPTKFYTDLYGGCTCAHAFVAMRFEGPDMPQISSIGSHHAATCLPPGVSRDR